MADEVQIDSLSVAIEQSAKDSSDSLSRLAKNLKELKGAVTGLRLTSTVNGLRGIAGATSKLDADKIAALGSLGGALKEIAGAGKISSSFAKQITDIGIAVNGLENVDTAKLAGLADALSPLASLDRAKLTSYINQLKQLPEVAESLDGMDMDAFAVSIRKAADAMKPLADEMEKVSRGFSALPTKIQRIIRENDRMTASARKGASGWRSFWKEVWGGSNRRSHSIVRELLGIGSTIAIVRKGIDTLSNAKDSVSDYIENLNLFGVAMGDYAEEAYNYAKNVESMLGIDPSQWTRYQSVIMDMSKSMGVASGTANTMSKALTQLTFDYASFYNLSTDEAANKVRSAIAGEIEPVRALGKDLSVAKLQLTATELGINGTVDAMTQADKAMLRTITLLRQSTSAQGDLARTLDEPANQMRIFAAQTEMLSRALGELFLPLLQEVLPYAISTVKVLRMVTEEFARLAGFELPEFKSASATEEVESLGGALEEAADEAERLFQLSFDELNILGSQASAGGSLDNTDKLTAELERLAAIQDAAFMKDVEDTTSKITDSIERWLTNGKGIEKWVGNIWNKFNDINQWVSKTGQALGLWDFPEKVWTILQNMSFKVEDIGIDFGRSELDGISGENHLKENVLGGALGAALLGGGALALLGGKGAAGALTFGLGLALSVGAIDMLYDSATAYGDSSTSNGLYRAVKGAFEAGLLGTGLGLLSGKGLKFALGLGLSVSAVSMLFDDTVAFGDASESNGLLTAVQTALEAGLLGTGLSLMGGKGLAWSLAMGLGISAISLWYDGSNQQTHTSDDLLIEATKGAIAGALGGVSITTLIGGIKGLRAYGLAASLGLASLSLIWDGTRGLTNSSRDDNLVAAVAQGLGIMLAGTAGAKLAAAAGIGAATGAGVAMIFTIPIVAALNITLSIKDVKADRTGTGWERLKWLLYPEGELKDEEYDKKVQAGRDQLKEVTIFEQSELLNEITTEAAETALNPLEFQKYGANVTEGITNGITESKDTVETATKGLADSAMLGITTALGIHSPSTVFWDYGLNIDEGLANGVSENMTIVTFAFDNVWESIQTGFSSFASGMISSAQNFVSTLDRILSSISFGGGFSTPAIPEARIPAFASGGIVEDGLFMANPTELVGRFANGRTAVANNEQITSAIESAVYRATIAANRASGGRGGGNIYLEGKKVGRILNTLSAEEQRRSGEVEIPTGGGF